MAYIRQSKIRTVVVAGRPLRSCGVAICDSATLSPKTELRFCCRKSAYRATFAGSLTLAAEDIRKTLLLHHFQRLTQTEKQVRGRRKRKKARLIVLEHVLPIPIGARQLRLLVRGERLLGNPIEPEPRRHHQSFLRAADG